MLLKKAHNNQQKQANTMNQIYLLHFHHKGGRVGLKIIIHPDSGENLISDAERGIFCRNEGAWKTVQCLFTSPYV